MNKWVLDVDNNLIHEDDDRRTIVCNFHGSMKNPEVLRDANRIVACPDLYEALEKMCKWHELQATWDKGDNGYYAAKKALAKARGEV